MNIPLTKRDIDRDKTQHLQNKKQNNIKLYFRNKDKYS